MDAQLMRRQDDGFAMDKDTLYVLGGAALIVFGASMLMASPAARKYIADLRIGDMAKELWPDVSRYLKLRSM